MLAPQWQWREKTVLIFFVHCPLWPLFYECQGLMEICVHADQF